jgi:hypothetical protein
MQAVQRCCWNSWRSIKTIPAAAERNYGIYKREELSAVAVAAVVADTVLFALFIVFRSTIEFRASLSSRDQRLSLPDYIFHLPFDTFLWVRGSHTADSDGCDPVLSSQDDFEQR